MREIGQNYITEMREGNYWTKVFQNLLLYVFFPHWIVYHYVENTCNLQSTGEIIVQGLYDLSGWNLLPAMILWKIKANKQTKTKTNLHIVKFTQWSSLTVGDWIH